MRNDFTAALLATSVALLLPGPTDAAFTPGDYFDSTGNRIQEFNPSGAQVATYTIPIPSGSDLRGLAFGPDGNLYAVVNLNTNYEVVAFNGTRVVQTYTDSNNVGGNIYLGQIAFDSSGHFYVGDIDGLSQFTIGSSASGKTIFNGVLGNSIFAVTSLPDGDLLVAGQSGIAEITASGTLVRQIGGVAQFVDLRGIAYDARDNVIFASMLGETGNFNQVMKIDPSTGVVTASTTYNEPGSLALTPDSRLLVGSGILPPGIFDLNLNLVGQLAGGSSIFVTSLPEPSSLTLCVPALVLGAVTCRLRSRDRRKAAALALPPASGALLEA